MYLMKKKNYVSFFIKIPLLQTLVKIVTFSRIHYFHNFHSKRYAINNATQRDIMSRHFKNRINLI